MAKITYKRTIRGRIDSPLEWSKLESFFDACFGQEKHTLPKYPQALGSIGAEWQEKDRAIHEASLLEELRDAYERRVTYLIKFSGSILPDPPEKLSFVYRPALGDAELSISSSSKDMMDNIISRFSELFPLPIGCVFISYDTRELYLAEFMKALLEKHLGLGIPVFVAKRDIKVGDDPTKKMIKESLLRANAIVSICTPFSMTSPWLWWETATVWARDQLVVPLFAGILPEEFNGPIQVLLQGKQLFEQTELMEAVREIGQRMVPSLTLSDLTVDEAREYKKLRKRHLSAYSVKKKRDES